MQNQIAKLCRGKRIALISATLVTVLSSGCATQPYPYIQAGMGLTINEDDAFKNPQHGRDPTAHFAIGVEGKLSGIKTNHSVYAEWDHWSHFRDGGPFNDRPETYKDEFEIGFKIGGLPR